MIPTVAHIPPDKRTARILIIAVKPSYPELTQQRQSSVPESQSELVTQAFWRRGG
jgi:hypothetical protein